MPTVDDFQKNLSRRPIVEIISSSIQEDIPFDGKLLTGNDEDEQHPHTIVHSSGRLLTLFAKAADSGNEEIHYKYTDIERREFTSIEFGIGTANAIQGVSMVELPNGNVGIMWLEYGGGSYLIKYKIITILGVDVVGITTLDSWADTLGDASGINLLALG